MDSAANLLPCARRARSTVIALALSIGAPMAAATPAGAGDTGDESLPIVFVHCGAGSAQQYESVARRFTSNGFPDRRIETYEYNSSSPAAIGAAPRRRRG